MLQTITLGERLEKQQKLSVTFCMSTAVMSLCLYSGNRAQEIVSYFFYPSAQTLYSEEEWSKQMCQPPVKKNRKRVLAYGQGEFRGKLCGFFHVGNPQKNRGIRRTNPEERKNQRGNITRKMNYCEVAITLVSCKFLSGTNHPPPQSWIGIFYKCLGRVYQDPDVIENKIWDKFFPKSYAYYPEKGLKETGVSSIQICVQKSSGMVMRPKVKSMCTNCLARYKKGPFVPNKAMCTWCLCFWPGVLVHTNRFKNEKWVILIKKSVEPNQKAIRLDGPPSPIRMLQCMTVDWLTLLQVFPPVNSKAKDIFELIRVALNAGEKRNVLAVSWEKSHRMRLKRWHGKGVRRTNDTSGASCAGDETHTLRTLVHSPVSNLLSQSQHIANSQDTLKHPQISSPLKIMFPLPTPSRRHPPTALCRLTDCCQPVHPQPTQLTATPPLVFPPTASPTPPQPHSPLCHHPPPYPPHPLPATQSLLSVPSPLGKLWQGTPVSCSNIPAKFTYLCPRLILPPLVNKTLLPLPLPPPIPWCFPNPNPSMGPVAALPRLLLARLASMLPPQCQKSGICHLVYRITQQPGLSRCGVFIGEAVAAGLRSSCC
ncbi:hypothetical protein VP01_1019g3 [Puccinia sorghi]|uniref:Uncharacterized protein n=1 Tax=Puccinia sorghi TaxID=27349 RepID=A0A0L6VV86_9BASI|nr:hypothetical protein VP01_1019g3 [Puccinia sorghi]